MKPSRDDEPRGTPDLAGLIQSLSQSIDDRLDGGDRAALRRSDPGRPPPAFWRLLDAVIEPRWPLPGDPAARDRAERAWAVVLNTLAIGQGLHRSDAWLGKSLLTAGLSELRLTRLLEATGDALHDEVRVVARYLAARGQPASWVELASLVLYPRGERADEVRRNIARSYFAAERRASQSNDQEPAR